MTFQVTVNSQTIASYQWYKNGSPIFLAISSSYTIPSAQTSDQGTYAVKITNLGGSVMSSNATLTVVTPVAITAQPQSQAVMAGQSATFTVGASGTVPLHYQWLFNGTPMAVRTNASLTLSNVQSNRAGSYTVVVTNWAGAVTSAVATLTVYVPAAITTQPLSQAVVAGQNAILSVAASGTEPLSYQWSFNGTALTDATNSALALNNVQTTDSGGYTVVVANAWGSATSAAAILIVLDPPAITAQPQSQAVVAGQSAMFTVAASGAALSYQWSLNGTPLPGATDAVLPLSNVQSNQAGGYAVVVMNPVGSVTSEVARLTVYVPAGITTQPQTQAVVTNQNAKFSVLASGTEPLSYQWNFNGTALTDATNASLALFNVQTTDAGGYTVVVTNAWGSVTSAAATLTVLIPPGIMTQPQDQAVVAGQTAMFAVTASGTAPLSYQWRFNGTSLAGATNAALPLSNVQSNQAGSYAVRVMNAAGAVTSAVATLTVYVPAGITTQPLNQTVVTNQNATFSVVARGTAPLSYQWNFNGTALTDATNASLVLLNVQTTDAGGYTVSVTNAWGAVTSVAATLTVLVPAGITTQPQDQAVVAGQTAMFAVTASGTAPLSYQWRFNGTSLAGATNAALPLSNVQSNQAGSYTVVVTNSAGSVTSAVATLTVYVPAGITTQPLNQTVVTNQNATFSVVARGTAPFSYQWCFNGTALADATNSVLALSNVQTTDAGAYKVVVTNAWGSVTSAVATLTVLVPPGITTQPQDQAVVAGQTAIFAVGASGTAPLRYQWRFNGTALTGATSATLPLISVRSNQAGTYDVVVTNAAGSITSTVATLTVYVPPAITMQPLSQTVTQGLSATLSVVAGGTAPLSYQWQYLGNNLAGATNATLVLSNMQFAQAGTYLVAVTNLGGAAVSAPAFLTVIPPPGSDLPVMQGLVAHLTFDGDLRDSSGRANHAAAVGAPNLVPGFIGAGGFNPFTEGSTNNYATFGTPSDLDFAKYTDFTIAFWARLPGGGWNGGAAHTDPAFISNKDWSSGNNVGWVVATGNDGRLQWNYRETGSQTRKDYDGPAGTFGNPIWHHVAVTFQRTVNAVTYLDGVPVSTNSIAPGTKVIDSGLPTNIGNDGTGDYPLTYGYWTNALANPTNGLNMDDVGIWARALSAQEICAIYNVGLVGQDLATVASSDLTVVARPRIVQSPVGLEVPAGSSPAFSVTANGTATLAYQWYANGVPIIGGTGPSLIVSNVQPAQAGSYCVVITNAAGSATSMVATLTVDAPPAIITQPQSVAAAMTASGFTFQFSVPVGVTYVIQASTNLKDWTPIATNVALTANVVFTDIQAAIYRQRLYRVMVP